MAFHPVVRRAIADRQPPRRRVVKPGTVTTSITVRLNVDPARIKKIGGREVQLNLSALEHRCVQPVRTTLFSNRDDHRTVRLIINKRRAWLLSVTDSGIIVFTYKKPSW